MPLLTLVLAILLIVAFAALLVAFAVIRRGYELLQDRERDLAKKELQLKAKLQEVLPDLETADQHLLVVLKKLAPEKYRCQCPVSVTCCPCCLERGVHPK